MHEQKDVPSPLTTLDNLKEYQNKNFRLQFEVEILFPLSLYKVSFLMSTSRKVSGFPWIIIVDG
jgi:hypothetical protein